MFNYKFSFIVEKGTFSGGSLPNVFFRTSALSHSGLFPSQPIIPTHLKKKTSSLAGGRSNSGFFLKSRVDIFLRLLIPGCTFYILKKKVNTFFFFFSTVVIWPKEYLDILGLLLYSNTIFINTKLFDISGSSNSSKKENFGFFLYYIFKVPSFSTWIVAFVEKNLCAKGGRDVLSIESIFKSAAWAEREVSELFGVFFFLKVSNRKLITDYFFKIYPMLKWVPSIGFSEVYLSSEGFFFNRSVKVFNASLS